ncbi:MAG: helix-turn-helix domain-containing protein, partial [Nitrospirota bacterium]
GVVMRTRSYRPMNAEARETLSLGLARGHSLKTMASVLKRAPSTVRRELARHVTRGQLYRACPAHTLATRSRPSAAAPS